MGASSSKVENVIKPKEPNADKLVSQHGLTDVFDRLDLNRRAPTSNGALALDSLKDWEEEVSKDPKISLARTIFQQTPLATALKNDINIIKAPHVFNTTVPFTTAPITSQNSSGRCWIFATTNVLRHAIQKKLDIESFQLSQSYLFFYDKLEKANYYLELSIENTHLPLNDRLVEHLATNPVNDGGQYDMSINLLTTYGVIPGDIFPESHSSGNSGPLNKILTTRLREHALILRRLHKSLVTSSFDQETRKHILRSKKEELMKEVWQILTITLRAPPSPDQEFTWEYLDKSGNAKSWTGTPKEFFREFTSKTYPALEAFSLINDPRNDYGKLYTVDKLGNIWGGRPVLYVNTEIERLKAAVVKGIKAGQPIFFGCDVGKSSDKESGLMDTNLYDYENAFNISLTLTKAERLQVKESAMTHAMVITAVHLDSAGKPVRYKVENSWGETAGKNGYFVMSDSWFEEYVYQVVIPRQLADRDHLNVLDKSDPVVLPAWDPMGALA
ncbi:hypothetical protein Clacol_007174 [Clathrus columnatus]|uniref:Cysteine proteinase 1, mitochondrial n=1 Tax=Clathrus columnatus TaxID=1419009 RepID=A0AAV5AH09_9AGAM|nr:hypothetical protein Clacol_007174 [Clathrus columnatus]